MSFEANMPQTVIERRIRGENPDREHRKTEPSSTRIYHLRYYYGWSLLRRAGRWKTKASRSTP